MNESTREAMSLQRRKAILTEKIADLRKDGWILVDAIDTRALLSVPTRYPGCFVLICCVLIVPAVFYFLLRDLQETTYILEVDEYGEVTIKRIGSIDRSEWKTYPGPDKG